MNQVKRGFTLIELLIVIAIIAILAGVVFVSLDPLTRFRDARDASRWTDATAILSAIKVNQVDNGGSYLAAITGATAGTNYIIGSDSSGCNTGCRVTTAAACRDLSALTTGTTAYLGEMPVSPDGSGDSWTTTKTGYYFTRNNNGSITVGACSAESPSLISVTR